MFVGTLQRRDNYVLKDAACFFGFLIDDTCCQRSVPIAHNPAGSAQQNAKRAIISHVLFPDPSLRPGSDVPSYHIIYPFADSLLLPAFFSRKATHSLPSRFRGIFFWRCVTTSESETAQKLILVSAGRPGRGEAGQCQWFELPRIADR